MRIRPIPEVRRYGSVVFYSFELGVKFMREVARQVSTPAISHIYIHVHYIYDFVYVYMNIYTVCDCTSDVLQPPLDLWTTLNSKWVSTCSTIYYMLLY